MKEYKIYYNNEQLKSKYSYSLSKTIMSLNLRKGDSFISYPFNFLNDEQTDNFRKALHYQGIELNIDNIEFSLIDTWNSSIKTIIKISLSKL